MSDTGMRTAPWQWDAVARIDGAECPDIQHHERLAGGDGQALLLRAAASSGLTEKNFNTICGSPPLPHC